jgi:hypothetical protein
MPLCYNPVLSSLLYVKEESTKFGHGGTQQVTAGEYPMTSGRMAFVTVHVNFQRVGSNYVDCLYPSQDMELHWSLRVRRYGHVGSFSDLTKLIVEVGNGRLTLEEQRTHFNLWALSKSPLLIGTHVS